MKVQNFKVHISLSAFLVCLFMAGVSGNLFAQTEEDAPKEKQRARMSLDFFSINNENQQLVATVRTRVEGFFQPVVGVKIKFYESEVAEENLLGAVETDDKGLATLDFSQDADTSFFTYISVLEDSPDFRDADQDIEVKKAFIEMTAEEFDSVRTVSVYVSAPDSAGSVSPVADVVTRVYVKRLFGLLPVSDEFGTTDEEGYLRAEFPMDIPGNENGELTIVAKVNDHEEFGNLEVSENIAWGTPLEIVEGEQVKEMWLSASNANAPRIFLVIVNLLLLGIFGVIIYIVRQLLFIKKLGIQ